MPPTTLNSEEPLNREKPHVFREATKEVAFRNTCGFWGGVILDRTSSFSNESPNLLGTPTRSHDVV